MKGGTGAVGGRVVAPDPDWKESPDWHADIGAAAAVVVAAAADCTCGCRSLLCNENTKEHRESDTRENSSCVRVACGKMVSIVQALLVNELLQLLVLLGKMRLLYLQLHKYGMRLSV